MSKTQKRGGPKTQKGKAIVSRNAIKHGIMATKVAILPNEKKQDYEELLSGLMDSLCPKGKMEELLVESIALGYWRLKRVYLYERSLLKKELKRVKLDYAISVMKLEEEIEEEKHYLEEIRRDLEIIREVKETGGAIEKTFSCTESWEELKDEIIGEDEEEKLFFDNFSLYGVEKPVSVGNKIEKIYHSLLKIGLTKEEILDKLLEITHGLVWEYKKRLKNAKKDLRSFKEDDGSLGMIPEEKELTKIMKYEGSIQKGIYRALNQLERLQRIRAGEGIPAPLAIDLTVEKSSNQKSLF